LSAPRPASPIPMSTHIAKPKASETRSGFRRSHADCTDQAASWPKPRRVVAKVGGHPGKPCPRVGFIVTKMTRPAENVVGSCTKHGTCGQWIKDGKGAITWTRLSCRSLACNAVRLQLHALACNPGNVLRTLATPEPIADGSMTTRRKTLIMARRLLAMRALSRSRSPGSRFRRTCLRRCFK